MWFLFGLSKSNPLCDLSLVSFPSSSFTFDSPFLSLWLCTIYLRIRESNLIPHMLTYLLLSVFFPSLPHLQIMLPRPITGWKKHLFHLFPLPTLIITHTPLDHLNFVQYIASYISNDWLNSPHPDWRLVFSFCPNLLSLFLFWICPNGWGGGPKHAPTPKWIWLLGTTMGFPRPRKLGH